MTEAGWVQIVTLIMSGLGLAFTGYLNLRYAQMNQKVGVVVEKATVVEQKMGQVVEKTAVVEQKIEETKDKVEETKGKMSETIDRLNGGVTKLLEEAQKRYHAEGRAAALEEAKIEAIELIRVNRAAWEKERIDKAIADALVLKTAADKARLDEMRQALAASEARQTSQTSTGELTEKKAPAAPTMVLDAQPQSVELHVAGTGTFKDAEENAGEKQEEKEK